MYNEMMDTIGLVNTVDPELAAAMDRELNRQRQNIELIASENIVSPAVMAAMGSILTNKYAEGLPGKRYYGGCVYVDEVENIAIERACKLFGAKYANVQPHSGAQANLAVYFALLDLGDTVMGMDLSQGGHLTHGSPVNMSGKNYNFVSYGVNADGVIDYAELEKQVKKVRPKLIVAGASAYPRAIDFGRSISMRWLSVPPDTSLTPRACSSAARACAFSTILRAYSLNSGFSASPKQTAFAAITCSSGPPWVPGNTAELMRFARMGLLVRAI